jgi:hypothetical protein
MMKKLNLMAGILGVMAFLMAPPSWAQQQVPPAAPEQQAPPAIPAPPAPPAIPAAPQASKLYNPQAVETLTGQVTAVNRQASKRAGKPDRVTMVLQTNQGPVRVHLGPADYLDQQALKLAVGDQVQVKGVKLSRLKAPTLIAGEVRKGDQVLKLRDDATGRPLWLKGRKPNGAT